MQNYIQTKMRIFENQTNDDYAILNFDQKGTVKKYIPKIKIQIIAFLSLLSNVNIENAVLPGTP